MKQFKLEVKYKYPNCNAVLNFKLDFHPIVWRRGIMYTITLSGTPVELFIPKNSNNSSVRRKTEEEKEREGFKNILEEALLLEEKLKEGKESVDEYIIEREKQSLIELGLDKMFNKKRKVKK